MHEILRSRTLYCYVRSFLSYAGWRAALIAALMLAGALLEGIGIILLIPFITLLVSPNVGVGAQAESTIEQIASRVFATFGLEEATHQISGVLVIFVGLAVLRGVVLWRRDITATALTLGFVDDTRAKLFRSLASGSWSTVSTIRHAKVQHVITSDIGRIAVGSNLLIRGVVSLFFFVTYLIFALVLSVRLTLVVLAFLVFAVVLLRPLQVRARRLGEDTTRFGESVFETIRSFMSGLKLAKASNAENQFVGEFEANVKELRQRQLQFSTDQIGARLIFQTSGYLLVSLIVAFGLFVMEITLPVTIAFIIIFSRLSGPFLSIQQSLQSIARMLPAFAAYQNLLASLDQPAGAAEAHFVAGMPANHSGPIAPSIFCKPSRIECSNITITRDSSDGPLAVLDELSLTIDPGETLALVGPTGAGKTTFADTLVGLLTPARGEIHVGSKRLSPSNITDWRSAISYVPQDPFLFDRSVRENLTWAVPPATDCDIWRSLEVAGAAKFVRSLPDGLDTRVGERGNLFSGGERQRICLARALLRKPLLLVLDEATNALDLDNEREFLAALATMGSEMSIVVISHRLSSLSVVDRIAFLSNGRIVETGSFDVLMSDTSSRFSSMLRGKTDIVEEVRQL